MRTAIAFCNLKQAALFFDRVLPVAFDRIEFGASPVAYVPEPLPEAALSAIVFGEEKPLGGKFLRAWNDFFDESIDIFGEGEPHIDPNYYERAQRQYLQDETGAVRRRFAGFGASLGLHVSDVITDNRLQKGMVLVENPVISLVHIDLIDVAKASWDQILEIRRDDDSAKGLRRLRAFLTEKLGKRNRAEIEDELFARLEDYDRVRKKHGFSLITSTLSALLDAKTITASISGGLAATLLGGTTAGLTSGVLIELAGVAVKLAETKHEMVNWQKGHELAYLIEVAREVE